MKAVRGQFFQQKTKEKAPPSGGAKAEKGGKLDGKLPIESEIAAFCAVLFARIAFGKIGIWVLG